MQKKFIVHLEHLCLNCPAVTVQVQCVHSSLVYCCTLSSVRYGSGGIIQALVFCFCHDLYSCSVFHRYLLGGGRFAPFLAD